MNMTQTQQQKAKRGWLERAAGNNPLLAQALGLTVVIVGATSLVSALWVSAIVAVHLILCETLAAAALKKVPEWLRIAIYFALGLAIASPAAYWLDRSGSTSMAVLRIFTPLLAANTITVARCERYGVYQTVPKAMKDGIANALGFTAVAVVIGIIRELAGAGTLLGRPIMAVHIRGILMPFGGFLLLGAMAAGLKFVLQLTGRQEAEEAMELVPEDRIERLEKKQQLIEQPEPPEQEEPPAPEPDAEEQNGEEAREHDLPKPIPVEQILGDLDGIEFDFDSVQGEAVPHGEKLSMEELEHLLDELSNN